MNSVEKGRLAEAKVVARLVELGVEVYLPTFGNGSSDLIAVIDGVPKKMETKFTSHKITTSSWEVSLRQVRHNTKSTTVKKFNSENADILAVYIYDIDTVVFVDGHSIHGQSTTSVRASMTELP